MIVFSDNIACLLSWTYVRGRKDCHYVGLRSARTFGPAISFLRWASGSVKSSKRRSRDVHAWASVHVVVIWHIQATSAFFAKRP